MKISFGEELYLVKFQHEVPGKEEKRGYRKTLCQVYKLLQDERQLISSGTAVCGPLDQFQKEVGRKVSLTRALQTIGPCLNKKLRTEIWKEYFARKQPPF
jgi:hypothetical protein